MCFNDATYFMPLILSAEQKLHSALMNGGVFWHPVLT